MRRPFRRLTIATATTAAAVLFAGPALAGVSHNTGDNISTIQPKADSGSEPAQTGGGEGKGNGGNDGNGKAPESAPVSNAGSAP